jgi:hypothetical protein
LHKSPPQSLLDVYKVPASASPETTFRIVVESSSEPSGSKCVFKLNELVEFIRDRETKRVITVARRSGVSSFGVLARGQAFTFAVLLCESIPIGCDSRCQTFNYLIPTMDSFIEAVANLSIIRGVAPNATLL